MFETFFFKVRKLIGLVQVFVTVGSEYLKINYLGVEEMAYLVKSFFLDLVSNVEI